ncbi:MAG: sulfotransferase [Rhizobium sp.]|nr:sulfotransferase [Rhizobium sp.]
MNMRDIDFLIIGATKSATTWLQQSLQGHPEIYMPDPELHYFSREYEKGSSWYLDQFRPSRLHRIIGEKSNSYMDTPAACGRIRRDLPDVKLIAQLRNPVERAYSDYCMLYRRGEVGSDIGQYLDPQVGGGDRLLRGGLYYDQLQAFMDSFPASRLLVLLYEGILTEPQSQLNTVARFLGLQSELDVPPVGSKVKDRTQSVVGPGLRRALAPLKPIVSPFRHAPVLRDLRSLIARPPRYAPLGDDLRKRLIEFYMPQVEKLGPLVGRDLSVWLADVDPAGGSSKNGRAPGL